ncbi:hypothetical protein K9M50_00970 [Patescibacteria group bacterium]|nr:hypothetical protein [Patescibacteria group bacterium]
MKRLMSISLMILTVFCITVKADNPPDKKDKKWTLTVEGNIASAVLQEPKKETSNLEFFLKNTKFSSNKGSYDNLVEYNDGIYLMSKIILSDNFHDKDNTWPYIISKLPDDIKNRSFLYGSNTIQDEENAWSKFISELKNEFAGKSLLCDLGAIILFNNIAYNHYDDNERGSTKNIDLNRMILQIKKFQKNLGEPQKYGECRYFSFTTAKLVEEAFAMPSYVITAYMHTLNQILIPDKQIILIDRGEAITHLDGNALKNKDDVDIAIMRIMKAPSIRDVIIDASKNDYIYNNKYNNFSGFWSRLQNRDNSDRTRNFLFNESLSLFSYLNEKGTYRVSLEKKDFGIQVYGVNKKNEYNRFLVYDYGTNIALTPWKYNSLNGRLHHKMFINLGAYYAKYKVLSSYSHPFHYSPNIQINIEDYFKYHFKNNLSLGMISNLVQFNQEIELPKFKLSEYFDGSFYFSPFIGWESKNNHHLKHFILAGLESTTHFSLPKSTKISAMPWISMGSKSSNEKRTFSYRAKFEFQPASSQINLFSQYESKKRYLQVRCFYEDYSKDLEKRSLFVDTYGFDLTFGQKFKKGRKIFISSAFKSNNSGKQNVNLSLGITF